MKRILAAAVVCAALLAPIGASAQTEPTVFHAFQSTQGCIYYLAQTQGNPPPEPGQRTWSGACTPGQPINGVGALSWTQDNGVRGGFSGRMVNGNWDGEIINHIEMFFDGGWHGDDMDGMAIQFIRGCVATQVPDDCTPAPR